MRVSLGCLVPVVAPLLVVGCGGSSPAPESPKPAPSVAVPVPQPPPVDLSPVAAPEDLVLRARLAQPESLVRSLSAWLGFPFDPHSIDAIQPGLTEALRLDAPVEIMVALRPDPAESTSGLPLMALSAGVSSVERARAVMERISENPMEEVQNGVWMTTGDSEASCAIAPAVGKANFRLVCGPSRLDVESVLSYATRGLPREDLGTADLTFTLDFSPIRERYASLVRTWKTVAIPLLVQNLNLDDPLVEAPLTTVISSLGDELTDILDDVERLTCSLSRVTEPEQLDIDCSMSFKKKSSFYAQLIHDEAQRSTTAPPIFVDLPRDATSASYSVLGNPALVEPMRQRIAELFDGVLASAGVEASLRAQVRAATLQPLTVNKGASAMAQGNGSPEPSPGKVSPIKPGDAKDSTERWSLWGIDADGKAYEDMMDVLAKLSSNPKAQAKVDELLHSLISAFAERTDQKSLLAFGKRPSLRKSTVRGLPKARGWRLTVYVPSVEDSEASGDEGDKKKRSASKDTKNEYAILLLKDGARTWVAWGKEEGVLVERLRQVTSGTPFPKLGTLPALSRLRGQSAISAGFMTVQSLRSEFVSSAPTAQKKARMESAFSTLPHQGQSPMLYWSTAVPGQGGITAQIRWTVPKEALEDMVVLGIGLAGAI